LRCRYPRRLPARVSDVVRRLPRNAHARPHRSVLNHWCALTVVVKSKRRKRGGDAMNGCVGLTPYLGHNVMLYAKENSGAVRLHAWCLCATERRTLMWKHDMLRFGTLRTAAISARWTSSGRVRGTPSTTTTTLCRTRFFDGPSSRFVRAA